MSELSSKPQEFRAGAKQISASALNKMLEAIPRTLTGNDVTVNRYGDRWVIENDTDFVQPPPELKSFVVINELEDCLLCMPYDITIELQDYDATLGTELVAPGGNGWLTYVAKPYDLQQSVFTGESVEGNLITFPTVGQRIYSGTLQQLTPNYYPGSIITASAGLTGLYSVAPSSTWSAETYAFNDVVTNAGLTWVCVDLDGSDSTPGADDTWDEVPQPIGTWISGFYDYGTLVSYGNQFLSIVGSNVGNALTDLTAWIPLPQPVAWSSVPTYAINQIVSLSGSNYICILGNQNTTPPNATYWTVITLTDQGAYNPATTYSVGQYVESSVLNIWLQSNIDGTNGAPGLSGDWLNVTSNFGQTIPIVWTDINADGRHWVQPDVGIAYIVTGDLVNGKYDGLADRRDSIDQEWFTEVATYSSGVTYALNAITLDSMQNYYQNIQDGNIGNTPASSPAYWTLLAPLSPVWILDNSDSESLELGSRYDAVIEPPEAGGSYYVSIVDDNQGEDLTDFTVWSLLNSITPTVWSAGAYESGDFVSDSGTNYVCQNPAGTSGTPGSSGDWLAVVLSDKGGYNSTVSYDTGDYVQEVRPLLVINSGEVLPIIAYTAAPFVVPAVGSTVDIEITTQVETTIWMVIGQTILINDLSPGSGDVLYGYISAIADDTHFTFSLTDLNTGTVGDTIDIGAAVIISGDPGAISLVTITSPGLTLNINETASGTAVAFTIDSPFASFSSIGILNKTTQTIKGTKTFYDSLIANQGLLIGDGTGDGQFASLEATTNADGGSASIALTTADLETQLLIDPVIDAIPDEGSSLGNTLLIPLASCAISSEAGGACFAVFNGSYAAGDPLGNQFISPLYGSCDYGVYGILSPGTGAIIKGGIVVALGSSGGGPTINTPVINFNSGNIATSVTTLAITGLYLSGLTSISQISLSSGMITAISSVTSTGFTIDFAGGTPPTYGNLMLGYTNPGGLFSGMVQVATVTGGTALPVPSLNSSVQNVAVNAPSFTITGTNISTTAADDSITAADALGWSGAFATSPAPTATGATITLSGTIAVGAAYASIIVNGVNSGPPVQVAQFVPAPTLNINTQAISTSTTSAPASGTGFAPGMTIAMSSGTATFTYLTPTTGIINFTSAPSTGTLNGTVTANGGASSTVEVADVTTSSPGPDVTMMTTNIPSNATTLIIYGNFFDGATPGNNTVAFSGGATGTVTASTATQLTVTSLSGLTVGPLTVVVTSDSVNSGAPVQVATVTAPPTINANTQIRATNALGNINIIFTGTGFGTNPSVVTVTPSSGTCTVLSVTGTSLTIQFTPANQPSVGSLTATVSVNGGPTSSSVQIATIVNITVATNTAYISTTSPSVQLTGTNFNPIATNDLVNWFITSDTAGAFVIDEGYGDPESPEITWVNGAGTLAVLTFVGTRVAGYLWATVGAYGGRSPNSGSGTVEGSMVAIIIAATLPPTVTLNTSNVTQATGSFTFSGTNFSATTAQDTVTFSSGTWAITSATTTSITVNFSVAPSLGSLTAIVVTAGGGSSGAAVQVATIVSAAVVWTMEYGTIAGNTPPATFTPSSSNIGTTSTGGAIVGAGATALAYTDLGTTANTINVAFTFVASENTSANGGPGAGLRWDNVGDSGVYAFVRNIGGSGPILAFFEASAGWSGVQGNTTSLTLTNGTTYTITLVDNGTSVIASLIDDVGTQSMTFSTTLNASKTKVAFGFLSQAGFSFTATDITGVTT